MKRRSQFLLSAMVALATAASLHLAIRDRFHHHRFEERHAGCGLHGGWERFHEKPAQPAPESGR